MSDTLHQLVLASSAEHAGRPALVGVRGETITYSQLEGLVGAVRAWLGTNGIGRGDVVALALPNGPELAALSVAVACAAECAPLNPASAAPEAAYLLDDLCVAALIVLRGHPTRVREVAESKEIPVIELGEGPLGALAELLSWHGPDRGTEARPDSAVSADVALRLHTSGTTAAPKQVPLTHGNLCYAADHVVASLDLSPDDRCLNVMPLFHSHGLIGALISTLAAGGSILCAPKLDPRHFLEWASAAGSTWYTAAPTVHRAVVDAVGGHDGFRLIRSASGPLPNSVADGLEHRFGVPVIEVYGMTEAYQIAANPLPPGERRRGSVGLATGTQVGVLLDGRVADRGSGEIVLRGRNVFAGYASPEQANVEAFVGPWFRTGDLGAIADDGYIRLTGRVKDIINRGGEKISPREIDDALLTHPQVRDAMCFPIPDDMLGEDVVAAIVSSSATPPTVPELRRYLAARLAPFKVPRTFVVVDELPAGPGGKPSRRLLAERLAALAAPQRAGSAALSDGASVSQLLARIWTELLHLADEPAADDHFFELGGSSLDVMELVVQIETTFNVDLPIDDVLELPTLGDMADEIAELRSGTFERDRGHLRTMRAGDSARVVVLVPGAHGVAVGLQAIADAIPPGPIVVGFHYPGHQPDEVPVTSIEELAELLVVELERMGLDHELVLYGNSLGSWVVFEAARCLAANGRSPRGVVLGDMYSPTLARPVSRPQFGVAGLVRRTSVKGRSLLRSWRKTLQARRAAAVTRHDRVFAASTKALAAYKGGPYPGDVELITTETRFGRLHRATYGWDDLVQGGVASLQASGEHEDLHRAHAALIADRISGYL